MCPKMSSGASASRQPRTFGGLVRGHARPVQELARRLREIVFDEIPDAEESFYGGQRPMAMYRSDAEVCWIQPLPLNSLRRLLNPMNSARYVRLAINQ